MRVKGIKNKLAVFVSVIVLAAGIFSVSCASVFAEEKSAEENDPANSWRFKDGKPVKQQEPNFSPGKTGGANRPIHISQRSQSSFKCMEKCKRSVFEFFGRSNSKCHCKGN